MMNITSCMPKSASQRFTEMGVEIKRLQQGTPEHKVLEGKII
jgi:RNA polymerase II elongation factor ELL